MGSRFDDTDEPPGGVDLTGAEVYAETVPSDRRVGGGGRWFIVRPDLVPADRPDLAVVFQRKNGKYAYRSLVTANMLRTDPQFTPSDLVPDEADAADAGVQ